MKHRKNWEDLANSIVISAYEDLVSGVSGILKLEKNDFYRIRERRLFNGERMIRNSLDFFNGSWYKTLTSLPASIFIKKAYEKLNEISTQCDYEGRTLLELKTLNKLCGMTVEINDGHITGLTFEEA